MQFCYFDFPEPQRSGVILSSVPVSASRHASFVKQFVFGLLRGRKHARQNDCLPVFKIVLEVLNFTSLPGTRTSAQQPSMKLQQSTDQLSAIECLKFKHRDRK